MASKYGVIDVSAAATEARGLWFLTNGEGLEVYVGDADGTDALQGVEEAIENMQSAEWTGWRLICTAG